MGCVGECVVVGWGMGEGLGRQGPPRGNSLWTDLPRWHTHAPTRTCMCWHDSLRGDSGWRGCGAWAWGMGKAAGGLDLSGYLCLGERKPWTSCASPPTQHPRLHPKIWDVVGWVGGWVGWGGLKNPPVGVGKALPGNLLEGQLAHLAQKSPWKASGRRPFSSKSRPHTNTSPQPKSITSCPLSPKSAPVHFVLCAAHTVLLCCALRLCVAWGWAGGEPKRREAGQEGRLPFFLPPPSFSSCFHSHSVHHALTPPTHPTHLHSTHTQHG